MVRIYYRSIFDELEDMRKYMDLLLRQAYEPSGAMLLPAANDPGTKMLPVQRRSLRVDVAEYENEVVVTADMMPGVDKRDITINLITPRSLEISCERNEEKKEENVGYSLHEHGFGAMIRIIPLPKAVTREGADASFKNGVLEVHLKKSTAEPKGTITIT
ncbi:MAG: Hsp20/alpha crystallin family protein [Methanoregula sp.]|jgi:HSP20 family protein|uniref:Hsp20/alpha crystallin family protein n=1 Tax=Methanoregula sp. TaxID=2052170 RepID=UPI003D101F15